MTVFENKIKHEITREKFEAIRDHKYSRDNDTFFGYTYGNVSSWLTWNRDENGGIVKGNIPEDYSIELKEAIKKSVRSRHIWDGPIDNWDQDKPPAFCPKLTTDIVFLGLNMAGNGRPILPGPSFQNARGHRRIVETFFGTEAEGAYFTDIIKPDKRILGNVEKKSNSGQLMQYIDKHRIVLRDHIRLFIKELDFIGAKKPLLIVFGGDAEWILNEGTDFNFRKERFYKIVKIWHYAYRYIKGEDERERDEKYKDDTRTKLKPYITIP